MAEPQSLNTMFQNAFVAVDVNAGQYSLRTTATGSGATQNVAIASTSGAFSGPSAESGFANGTVVAPGVGATIATHTPPAGNAGKLHKITATCWFSVGSPVAADNFNMAFKFGGGVISAIPVVPALNAPVTVEFYFNAAVGTPFSIVAVGAGTAAVAYNAFLTATKVVS